MNFLVHGCPSLPRPPGGAMTWENGTCFSIFLGGLRLNPFHCPCKDPIHHAGNVQLGLLSSWPRCRLFTVFNVTWVLRVSFHGCEGVGRAGTQECVSVEMWSGCAYITRVCFYLCFCRLRCIKCEGLFTKKSSIGNSLACLLVSGGPGCCSLISMAWSLWGLWRVIYFWSRTE